MSNKTWMAIACFMLSVAIACGALGAHALVEKIPSNALASFKTGVLYLMINAIALMATQKQTTNTTKNLIFVGTLLFSCSIFGLSCKTLFFSETSFFPRILGPITPIGGLLMIIGWVWTGVIFLKKEIPH